MARMKKPLETTRQEYANRSPHESKLGSHPVAVLQTELWSALIRWSSLFSVRRVNFEPAAAMERSRFAFSAQCDTSLQVSWRSWRDSFGNYLTVRLDYAEYLLYLTIPNEVLIL